MNYLAIDTTNSTLTVVLRNGEQLLCTRKEMEKAEHSTSLMPTIDEIISKANMDIKGIENFAVNVGPGSFTGIRIGVSSMTAMSYANKAKRISFSTFEILAQNRGEVMVSVDAGHGNTYLAKCKDGEIVETDFIEAGKEYDFSNVLSTPEIEEVQAIDQIVMKKFKNNEFVDVFVPFYMRKSQAERNLE